MPLDWPDISLSPNRADRKSGFYSALFEWITPQNTIFIVRYIERQNMGMFFSYNLGDDEDYEQ